MRVLSDHLLPYSRGIASTMLIKLKYSIGDRFAFYTSSLREEVNNLNDSFRKQAFFKYEALFNSNIFIISNNLLDNILVR